MTEIHFVHTSDWHLGFNQYNKTQRNEDFRRAAEKTIDKIIELNPQFVLHTGDIFHKPNPTPATIRQAVKVLSKLDNARIPMYIIRGNHDGNVSKYLKRGGGIISLLNDLELLQYVDDEILYLDELNAALLGVGYYPGKQVSGKIEQLMAEDSNFIHSQKFKIIGIHAYVEGQIESHMQISLKKIRDLGVHYLGAGHYHIPWKDEERAVFAPGSVETTKITDAERMDIEDNVSLYSSFYEIKSNYQDNSWSDLEVKTHRVQVRPKILLKYTTEHDNVEDIRNELEDKLQKAKDTIMDVDMLLSMELPILSVNIYSQLEFEEVNKIKIDEWFVDDYLHIISSVDGKSNSPQFSSDLGNSVIREDVIMELIQQNNLDPKVHTNMILELLQHFGDHSKSRKLNEETVKNLTSLLLQEADNLPRDEVEEEKKTETKVPETVSEESSDDLSSEELSQSDDDEDVEDEIMSIIGLDAFMEDDN